MEITDYQNLVCYWWFAADRNGNIATFNNAGVGESPVCLRQDKNRYEGMANAWLNYIDAHLPKRGSAFVSIVAPGALKSMERRGTTLAEYGGDAREDAEKGFFVYDAELNHTSVYYTKFLEVV